MEVYAPKYYLEFNCIADKCNHSCCVGWEIDIDDITLKKYNSLNSEHKYEILKSIDLLPSPHFMLTDHQKCANLDETGLCKIIKSMGDEYLCDICREHPRFYNFTNLGKEIGLGLSCEEACRIILNSDDFDNMIILGNDNKEPEIVDFDAICYRETVFKILKDEEMNFEEKIYMMCDYYDIYFDLDVIIPTLSNLEYLNPSHKDMFLKINFAIPDMENIKKIERALAYFVYRHCSESESFTEFASSLGFSMLCAFLILSNCSDENIENIARMVSEELEYSQENVALLKSIF